MRVVLPFSVAVVFRYNYAVLARHWLPLTFFCRVRPDYFRILNIIRIPAHAYMRTCVHAYMRIHIKKNQRRAEMYEQMRQRKG